MLFLCSLREENYELKLTPSSDQLLRVMFVISRCCRTVAAHITTVTGIPTEAYCSTSLIKADGCGCDSIRTLSSSSDSTGSSGVQRLQSLSECDINASGPGGAKSYVARRMKVNICVDLVRAATAATTTGKVHQGMATDRPTFAIRRLRRPTTQLCDRTAEAYSKACSLSPNGSGIGITASSIQGCMGDGCFGQSTRAPRRIRQAIPK